MCSAVIGHMRSCLAIFTERHCASAMSGFVILQISAFPYQGL